MCWLGFLNPLQKYNYLRKRNLNELLNYEGEGSWKLEADSGKHEAGYEKNGLSFLLSGVDTLPTLVFHQKLQ